MIIGLLKFILTTVLFIVTTSGKTNTPTRVDGKTYPIPATTIQTNNSKLSTAEINDLASQTAELKPVEGGFKPLTTNLPCCQGSYSKVVDLEHLSHPFFVVGDDEISYEWIKHYKSILQKIGATGFVIKAENIAAIERLHHASGLLMNPAKGDDLAKFFNINCYPVLITKHRIEN